MTRTEAALKYFDDGCDCGKALLKAYEPILSLDEVTRERYRAACSQLLGSPAERCEVVSGALEVLAHLGASDARSADARVGEGPAARFKERFLAGHGSTSCKKLLGYDLAELHDFSEAVDTGAVDKVCRGLIKDVCSILDELISEIPRPVSAL